MSFVDLSIVINTDCKMPSKAAQVKAVAAAGGLRPQGNFIEVAKKISEFPWVRRVVATQVKETNLGVWRKGRKS